MPADPQMTAEQVAQLRREGRILEEYPPGSIKAQDAGCRCPFIDNAHGRGYREGLDGKPLFVVSGLCDMHRGARSRSRNETPDVS